MRLPWWLATRVARPLVSKPHLALMPGWQFGSGTDAPGTRVQLRTRLWERARDEGTNHPVVVPWYGGGRIRLFLGNDMSYCVYVGGSFEPNEFTLLDAVLRPGMVVVDGGANDGFYTVFAARRVGRNGTVVALEPSAREYARLLSNVRLNRLRNVVALETALHREPGRAALAIAETGHEGQNALGETVTNPTVEVVDHVEVAVDTLDAVVGRLGLRRVDVIKLDVEGSELAALQGATATLERFRPLLQLEAEAERLAGQDAAPGDAVDFLDAHGYHTFVFDPESGRLRPPKRPDEPEGNLIAAPVGWEPPELPTS
jgi:FkbM family methyltransferase